MIAVQVNGKLRDTCEMDLDTEEAQLKEIVFSLEKVTKYTEGKDIKKVIVIPNKLVNIVCT
jgi:leucyl-tRNA synthetase